MTCIRQENLVLKKLRKDEIVSVIGIGAFPYASLVEMVGNAFWHRRIRALSH